MFWRFSAQNSVAYDRTLPRLTPLGSRLIRGWSAIVAAPDTFIYFDQRWIRDLARGKLFSKTPLTAFRFSQILSALSPLRARPPPCGCKSIGPWQTIGYCSEKAKKKQKNESIWKRTKTASDFTWILFCILSSRGCKTKAQVARWEIVSEWNGYLTMRLFCRMKAGIGWCHFLDLNKAPAPRLQPLSLRQRSTNCLSRKVHWGCGNQDPNMFRYHTCAEPLHIITTSGRQQPVLLAKSPKAFRMC
jgi:hypothetical protein